MSQMVGWLVGWLFDWLVDNAFARLWLLNKPEIEFLTSHPWIAQSQRYPMPCFE